MASALCHSMLCDFCCQHCNQGLPFIVVGHRFAHDIGCVSVLPYRRWFASLSGSTVAPPRDTPANSPRPSVGPDLCIRSLAAVAPGSRCRRIRAILVFPFRIYLQLRSHEAEEKSVDEPPTWNQRSYHRLNTSQGGPLAVEVLPLRQSKGPRPPLPRYRNRTSLRLVNEHANYL